MERAEFNFIRDAFSQIIDDIAGNPDWSDAASAVSADLGALERELEGKVVSPGKSLEEAAEEYSKRVSDGHNYRDLTCGFIAGAEWQASQMPMPEDTVLFNKGVAEGRRLEREDILERAITWLKENADKYIVDMEVSRYKPPKFHIGGKCWEHLKQAMEEE